MTDKRWVRKTYRAILADLASAYKDDVHFSDGRILGSMCTKPLNIARKAHMRFIEANLGNPGLCPGTKKLASEVLTMLGSLLHVPREFGGLITSGGTESNITSLWIARNKSNGTEVILPRSAHVSVIKACNILNLKTVYIELDENYRMRLEEVERAITNRTAALVAVAGSTELGVVDPIQELSQLACEHRLYLHVDAAFGGFVLPFLRALGYSVPEFDFVLEGVSGITIDAHKMGLATIPSGALLLRDKRFLSNIIFETPYLTGGYQTTLSGTQASGAIVGTYAAMKILGFEGYKRVVQRCMNLTELLVREVEAMGLELVVKPTMNIVGIRLKKLQTVYTALEKHGWRVSLARNPPCLRIVVMPHVTKRRMHEFISDLKKVCKKLKEI